MERREDYEMKFGELEIQLDIIHMKLYYKLQQLAMETKYLLNHIELEK